MDYGISGKTALVTGAKRGIGYAAAVMFARAGVNTAFIDIDDTKEETEEFNRINQDNYDKNMAFLRYYMILNVAITLILNLIVSFLFAGGVYLIAEKDGSRFFVTGHPEYDPDTLDKELIERTQKQLLKRIKEEAKSIHEKYVSVPETTDFAIMFLPIEGLYAEVVRDIELMDTLQNQYKIVVCGPTTLTALLNSLQLGFKTLYIDIDQELCFVIAQVVIFQNIIC